MDYLLENFGLTGKTAVITGGGGAICGAIAEAFLKAGAKTILLGRNMKTLEEKKSLLVTVGCMEERIMLVKVDLGVEENVKDVMKQLARTETMDILVNGVGGSGIRKPLTETDVSNYEEVLKLNLIAGCFLPSKYFADYWIKNKIKGQILNIASMASFNPLSGSWAYSAAKAAVMNQTAAQARELAEYGIRVNAIAPGFFLGKQNRHLLIDENDNLTERGKSVLAHTPMGRFGDVSELGAASVFLVSQGAAFITGTTLPVDGGYLCHNI